MSQHIWIGWDPREEIAYKVARRSILRNASNQKLWIHPLELGKLGHILTRPIERKDGKLWCPISQAPMATEFAISRFCVPFLSEGGWSLFMDSDVVVQGDIWELFNLADPKFAVMVVKHRQEFGPSTKMDGQAQLYYDRKNWSSVMLWNLDHPSNKKLTGMALNTWPGRDLHAFKWLEDSEIGSLPQKWNWLVNVTPGEPPKDGILHFTLGGPWFPGWKAAPHDEKWIEAKSLP